MGADWTLMLRRCCLGVKLSDKLQWTEKTSAGLSSPRQQGEGPSIEAFPLLTGLDWIPSGSLSPLGPSALLAQGWTRSHCGFKSL